MDHSPVRQTIELLKDRVRKMEVEIVGRKKTINDLAAEVGDPIPYPNIEQPSEVAGAILPDTYYGQPLARVARDILERRKASGLSAANVKDIQV